MSVGQPERRKSRNREEENLLSSEVRQQIDYWIAKYPPERKQSAVIPALHIVQAVNGGYLTDKLLDAVAEYLEMRPISVYEVATFYSMYELKPIGRHKISVCTNISCQLSGSDEVVAHLQKRLGIGFGETTPDHRFTVKEAECLGACGGAPMMMAGHTYHENLTSEKIDQILEALK
ncbi:NADH-quinone oxidoreductase subunit NuoE [Nitrosococcus oceani]|uniref:NADH-quinone oxidoreductase subunit E n=2 Tax=Nitrosococcus oceani TaxID=1229 RepID=Q3J832_NITOC|nr:NADH-quinone oxidoreductase subunit NuoE [Nitrosococcus oceani]KFI18536.1 NADH dehydrogenase [Nitrosococcus oceani C-27]ABA59014.1 NADH dehydrogenase subunit E [Nitrosococcus oceani ATCC 19707]EDZ65361.1 NADH-quinone oxidoreductase, E subunit subfamily [Nitrosococcus oceani AFC27]KFI21764.1 NADH dehydrogenase [Nitrosococcus oceani]GEM21224.1 NADH dehydrogenase subunit E [Nitrosococcus oceani]